MFKTILLLALAAGASAFVPSTAKTARRTAPLNVDAIAGIEKRADGMAQCLPFLKCPPKLDGSMVGDVGFDPMGLSDVQPDLKYARACELKHGRICMLAVVGFVTEEYFHLPGAAYTNYNPLGAIAQVGTSVNGQILAAIAVIELATIDITYGDGEPGDYGLDPLKFLDGKSQYEIDRMKTKELKNGRLAMMAFLGQIVQTLLFPEIKLLGNTW